MHTCAHFCYNMVHCEIWHWCIVTFVQPVYYTVSKFNDKTAIHISYRYSSTGWFGTSKCFLFICIPLCRPLAMSGLSSLGVLYTVNPDPRRGPHLLVIWIDGAPRAMAVGLEFGENLPIMHELRVPWGGFTYDYFSVSEDDISHCTIL